MQSAKPSGAGSFVLGQCKGLKEGRRPTLSSSFFHTISCLAFEKDYCLLPGACNSLPGRPTLPRSDFVYNNGKPTTPHPIGNADRSSGLLATSILTLSSVPILVALRFATRI